MLRIGEFSRIGRVSVKALRLYDELGLLRPEEVDRWTSYRYYSVSQLPRLHRIVALKDLGLSLEQIAQLLSSGLTPEQIKGMLVLKQAELRQQMEESQARLERVKARLRLIEEEGVMPDYEIVVKGLDPVRVASLRRVIPSYSDVGHLHQELFAYFNAHGLKEAAPCFSTFYDEEYKESEVDAEADFPVDGNIPETDGVKCLDLQAIPQVACTVHRGPYETIDGAYGAVLRWIEANGYRVAGHEREVYLYTPHEGAKDPSEFVTEVQFPVERAR